jgi:Bacterial PH domain
VRDMIVFTNERLILIDKQGMTGKKIELHSIPYSKITHFSVETAGTLDLDSELKVSVSGGAHFAKTFGRGVDINDVQRVLATYVLKVS